MKYCYTCKHSPPDYTGSSVCKKCSVWGDGNEPSEYEEKDQNAIVMDVNNPINGEIGCPPDYNPGFCYDDDDCVICWKCWIKDNKWLIRESRQIVKAVEFIEKVSSES